MRDYAVTITGQDGTTGQWEDHLDVLPDACLVGWEDGAPRLTFTVEAETPMEAIVTGVSRIRDLGIVDEVGLAATPASAA